MQDRIVPRTRAEQWCIRASTAGLPPDAPVIPHFETSAKTAINVEEAFTEAASLALMYAEKKKASDPQLFVPPIRTIDMSRNNKTGSHMRNGCC
jgi:hypothetical protein